MTETLTEVAEGVLIRPMLTINDAIDVFLSRGFEDTTRATYGRVLYKFADQFPRTWDVAKITEDDVSRFLARYQQRSRGTRAHAEAVLSSFFTRLVEGRKIKGHPMQWLKRTRRLASEDLAVVTVTGEDVARMLAEAKPWSELLAVAVVAYMGPRRKATAALRLEHYDRKRQEIMFSEKGGKTIWKPVPTELARLLHAAIQDGAIVQESDYLIPPQATPRKAQRDERVIWRLVTDVAKRAGVKAHVHALRAAFAVFYLESHGRDSIGLQELMGHKNPNTTRIYLRKMDKRLAMEPVRDLSWAAVKTGNEPEGENPQIAVGSFLDLALMGAGGFEPPLRDLPVVDRDCTQHSPNSIHGELERMRENGPDYRQVEGN